jgi:hypothetical protein
VLKKQLRKSQKVPNEALLHAKSHMPAIQVKVDIIEYEHVKEERAEIY